MKIGIKKSIKISIFTLIIIFIFSVNIFAYTIKDYTAMSKAQIEALSEQDVQKAVDELAQYLKGNNGTSEEMNLANNAKRLFEAVLKEKRSSISDIMSTSTVTPSYEDFDYKGYQPSSPTDYNSATKIAGNILAVIRNIGVVVALVALSIIGIKYMIGSVEEKAQYKKSMIPFVIGLILVAAGTTLVKIIYDIATSIF